MKRYFYVRKNHLSDRGYDIAIEVFYLKSGCFPRFVGGNYKVNSASYKGEYAVAAQIISDIHGHKMDKCGYDLLSKNILIGCI